MQADPTKGDPFGIDPTEGQAAGHTQESTDEVFEQLSTSDSAIVEISYCEAKALAWASQTVAQLAMLEGYGERVEPLMSNARIFSEAVADGDVAGELRVSRSGLKYLTVTSRVIVYAAESDRFGPVGRQMSVAYWNGIRSHLNSLSSLEAEAALEEFSELCPSPDSMAAFAASAADMLAIRADLRLIDEFSAS